MLSVVPAMEWIAASEYYGYQGSALRWYSISCGSVIVFGLVGWGVVALNERYIVRE